MNKIANLSVAATIAVVGVVVVRPVRLAGQGPSRYAFYDLGTLGGAQSYVYDQPAAQHVLNDRGSVAGFADTPAPDPLLSAFPGFCFYFDCQVTHAFQWNNGISDLGVLSAGWSSLSTWVSSYNSQTHAEYIAGIAQNDQIDPTFSIGGVSFPEMRAVLWTNGKIRDLGTLQRDGDQGDESAALAVNKYGQVAGVSTNCSTALNCPSTLSTSLFNTNWGWNHPTHAFTWSKGVGMQDLGTLGGSDAAALLINDQGQIAGASYINSTPSAYCSNGGLGAQLTTGAFLWQNGTMKNLGGFGGTCTYPLDLNNLGYVVGLSTEKGDRIQDAFYWDGSSLHKLPNSLGGSLAVGLALNDLGVAVGRADAPGGSNHFHAAMWLNATSAMTDLGTLQGDYCAAALSINVNRQVVGYSAPPGTSGGCDFGQTRAFLWQNGSMVDLNTLIPATATLYLAGAATINGVGEIAGVGLDANGNQHAYLLIPCGGDIACQNAPAGPSFNRLSTTLRLGFAKTRIRQ